MIKNKYTKLYLLFLTTISMIWMTYAQNTTTIDYINKFKSTDSNLPNIANQKWYIGSVLWEIFTPAWKIKQDYIDISRGWTLISWGWTAWYVPKFSWTTWLWNSTIFDNWNVWIWTTSPSYKLTLIWWSLWWNYWITPNYANRASYWVWDWWAAIYNDNSGYKRLMIVGNNSNGWAREIWMRDNLTVYWAVKTTCIWACF